MKTFHLKLILILLLATVISTVWSQPKTPAPSKAIVVTGARFTYPLVQKWIDEYNVSNPEAQIVIESRGTTDPASYDILIDAYEPDEAIKKTRDFVYLGRYPILPVANSKSTFAHYYSAKGLNRALINQIYFEDLYADKDKDLTIVGKYNVYTRLQKSGPPIVFTHFFEHEQKDIRGKAIAGADEHLLKAILRDSIGVSYLPLSVIYDRTTHTPLAGLTVLPVDLNGNNKISDDEKIYADLASVTGQLELRDPQLLKNVPVGSIHISISKNEPRKEAIDFIQWVLLNGQKDLAPFGYLKSENGKFEKYKNDFFQILSFELIVP